MADAKHFVTYNQETNRDTPNDDTIVSARALHEIYLPPFYSAVVQAHVASVMCAYPLLNGIYSCQNPSLLTGLLDRGGASPDLCVPTVQPTPRLSIPPTPGSIRSAGASTGTTASSRQLSPTGRSGPQRSTRPSRRILTEMFRFDLFNDPPTGSLSSPASTPADRAFALNVAERGVVLLQNTARILPLSTATTKSIAVIGPDGTTDPVTAGGGSSHVTRLVHSQSAEGHHHPRRIAGHRHLLFGYRSDPGCCRCREGAGSDRVRELLGARRQ